MRTSIWLQYKSFHCVGSEYIVVFLQGVFRLLWNYYWWQLELLVGRGVLIQHSLRSKLNNLLPSVFFSVLTFDYRIPFEAQIQQNERRKLINKMIIDVGVTEVSFGIWGSKGGSRSYVVGFPNPLPGTSFTELFNLPKVSRGIRFGFKDQDTICWSNWISFTWVRTHQPCFSFRCSHYFEIRRPISDAQYWHVCTQSVIIISENIIS